MTSAPPSPARRRSTRDRRPREARVVIRPITRRDFFGWHDALSALRSEQGARLDETHALRVWQWLEARPARLEAFVAELGERVCGLVHFQELLRPASGTIDLLVHDLWAHPEVRVRGVHDDLLAAVHAEAARRGAERIRAFEPGSDEASLRYWDRIGDRADVVAFGLPVRRHA